MYQLLQSTHFEMYLLVILPFDSVLGKGDTPLYIGYIGMSKSQSVWFFLRHFGQKYSIDFGHVGLKLDMLS